MGTKIDIERCAKAMRVLYVHGAPRRALIEEAIGLIQKDPACLRKGYLGIKNYAHFGDQRHDSNYGYGPTHGSIVFEIGRRDRDEGPDLGADEIYLLECVRDFGTIKGKRSNLGEEATLNLCDTIKEYLDHKNTTIRYEEAIASKYVDSVQIETEG